MKGRTGVERVVVLVERIDQGKEVGEDRANDVQSDPTNAEPKEQPEGLALLRLLDPGQFLFDEHLAEVTHG